MHSAAWADEAVADSVVALPTVQAEPLHKTANMSYKVAGKRYHPSKKVSGFSQTGKASWYGPGFHGRRTASGERFNMHALTAAHRTLPIPSYAKVTNLSNGKSVVVRINDRGPFHGKRVLDVSKAAAQKLGFIHAGQANVKIEQIVPGAKSQKVNSNEAVSDTAPQEI
ncbi:MAG: septal ring lytic transglycosylase RlpA family protein [Neisseria sp.]|nr:septal ring lytic transglycosylase RlpA family protein [Neisseria sp.]